MPPEAPADPPSGPPVGGWEGQTPVKTRTRAAFLATEEGGVGLRRAIVARLWGCHVIAPARPSMPRIILLGSRRWGPHQKTAQHSNYGRFCPPTGPANHASERAPIPPKLGHRTASRWGVGGGGRGAKSSKTRNLTPFWQKAFILIVADPRWTCP